MIISYEFGGCLCDSEHPSDRLQIVTIVLQSLGLPAMPIQLLYDGECPLCLREVNFLRQRDAGRGRVTFIDIAADDYSGSVDYATAMERIHAIMPDGRVIVGIEVFRQIYAALDLGWVYAITRLPGLSWLADRIYDIWADYRLRVTGRPDLATLLKQRSERACGCAVDDTAEVSGDIERSQDGRLQTKI